MTRQSKGDARLGTARRLDSRPLREPGEGGLGGFEAPLIERDLRRLGHRRLMLLDGQVGHLDRLPMPPEGLEVEGELGQTLAELAPEFQVTRVVLDELLEDGPRPSLLLKRVFEPAGPGPERRQREAASR